MMGVKKPMGMVPPSFYAAAVPCGALASRPLNARTTSG